MESRKSRSTSLTSIEEASDMAAQLPTPRDTPVPESFSRPKISDALFDDPNVFLDAGDGTRSRVYTAASGNTMLTIIDRSGVFEMEAVFCVCSKDANCDKLLLQIGLFPATFISIKTVFTFAVLDDFLKDNLECKTTAQQYYAKLQSMTSKMFPDLVPVRFQILCYHHMRLI
jgi:hypothetical protein